MVTGPPGAGKSTVAASLASMLDPSALVAGDDFFAFLRNGVLAPWAVEAHAQNAAVLQAAAAACGRLVDHCSVVYDGVLGPWFLPDFLAASGLQHLHYVVLLPPENVCVHRVEARGGHDLTDGGVARHMWREFHRAAVDSRHVWTNHEAEPDDVARDVVGRLRQGSIRYP